MLLYIKYLPILFNIEGYTMNKLNMIEVAAKMRNGDFDTSGDQLLTDFVEHVADRIDGMEIPPKSFKMACYVGIDAMTDKGYSKLVTNELMPVIPCLAKAVLPADFASEVETSMDEDYEAVA